MGILPASAANICALWNIHGAACARASPECGQRCEQIERSLGWAEAKREEFSGDPGHGQLQSPLTLQPPLPSCFDVGIYYSTPQRTHVHFAARWRGGRIAVVHHRVPYLHVYNEREERELVTHRLIFEVWSSGSFSVSRMHTASKLVYCSFSFFFPVTRFSPKALKLMNSLNCVAKKCEKTQTCVIF